MLSQALLPKKTEGLVAAYEMMVVTSGIQNLIRENKVYNINSAIQTGRQQGMFLLDDNLFKLWKDGVVAKEEVLMRSGHPAELSRKISQAERGVEEQPEVADEDTPGLVRQFWLSKFGTPLY